jgi:hypothetical protein
MNGSRFSWMAPRQSRRLALWSLCAGTFLNRVSSAQSGSDSQKTGDDRFKLPETNEDPRLPDGRSQKNAIAKQQHDEALKDAERLIATAEDLRDELRKAGMFVVPVSSVKKTEEIEKLAKRIRGRLRL